MIAPVGSVTVPVTVPAPSAFAHTETIKKTIANAALLRILTGFHSQTKEYEHEAGLWVRRTWTDASTTK